jgi:putative glutamine amidotransferase
MARVSRMPARSAHPTIGITLPSRAAGRGRQGRDCRNAAAYRRALEAHGARIVELTPEDGSPAIEGLHAVLLTGGGDVDPRRYGQPRHTKTENVDAARDELELELARAAVARKMPVLGICRGAQLLGIALGGKLIQDIESETVKPQRHAPGAGKPSPRHWVRIAPRRLLHGIMRAERVRVNTSHHQANRVLGRGVRAVAWSEDGVIEGIEKENGLFTIGVQWHPERMWRRSPRQRRLFEAFVAAARDYAAGTSISDLR